MRAGQSPAAPAPTSASVSALPSMLSVGKLMESATLLANYGCCPVLAITAIYLLARIIDRISYERQAGASLEI